MGMDPHKVVCRNCEDEGERHMLPVMATNSDEAVLWCSYCGTICTPNLQEAPGSDDFVAPEATISHPGFNIIRKPRRTGI
jgi:hypothetical protein